MRSHGAEELAARRAALQIRRRQAGESTGRGSEQRQGAVLLLHGSGDSGAAILSWFVECGMAEALCARKLTLHALDAPWRRFSPAGGELWRVWFDRTRSGDNEEDVAQACELVATEARQVCPEGGVVFVVGFSQVALLDSTAHSGATLMILGTVVVSVVLPSCQAGLTEALRPTLRCEPAGKESQPLISCSSTENVTTSSQAFGCNATSVSFESSRPQMAACRYAGSPCPILGTRSRQRRFVC